MGEWGNDLHPPLPPIDEDKLPNVDALIMALALLKIYIGGDK